jgi:hypothetical protein
MPGKGSGEWIIYRFFYASLTLISPEPKGTAMNMHLLAGIAVLLILVGISAYREALRNEPISRFRMNGGNKLPPMDDTE